MAVMLRHLCIILMLCCNLGVAAQSLTADSIVVSLLTCAPGNEVYELEGHSGLRLRCADYDVVANWGVFDFNSPGFVYRFVKGETDYRIGICPTEIFLLQYEAHHRRVTEQVLNLTAEQSGRVAEMVSENLLPENRVYRYNYVMDNCATRPIAIIERAIGDTITFAPALTHLEPKVTFRRVMQHYHSHYPWYQFGIDLALGSGIDRAISRRAVAFAPAALEQMAAEATIHTADGEIPLVNNTEILVSGDADGTADEATPWYLSPLFVFTLLLTATTAITIRDIRRKRISRLFDSALYAITGLTGMVLTFLIFISVHEATSPNYLYLWVNPMDLFVAILVWSRKRQNILRWLQIVNLAGLIAFAVISTAGIQTCNAAFIPLMLTVALRAATHIYISRLKK